MSDLQINVFIFFHCLLPAELSVCLCDTAERVRNIIADAPVTGNHIKHIILINCSDELDVLRAEASASSNGQIQIHTFNEIMVRLSFVQSLTMQSIHALIRAPVLILVQS